MPSQNHCVCIYTILLILCGWYAYQRREEAAPADKVTGWSGQRSAVLSISASAFLPFFKRRKLTVQEQQSILYGHSPERIDYIYTKAQNLILYFVSFLIFFCDWQCAAGRCWKKKRRNRRPYHRISFHKRYKGIADAWPTWHSSRRHNTTWKAFFPISSRTEAETYRHVWPVANSRAIALLAYLGHASLYFLSAFLSMWHQIMRVSKKEKKEIDARLIPFKLYNNIVLR